MGEAWYRTGQVAKALGVSSYTIRRLADSGLIEASYSGHQWRFPASEVDRLLKEGIPDLPAAEIPAEAATPAKSPNALLAAPSETIVAAAEKVTVTENLLKQRRLELQLQEVESDIQMIEQQRFVRIADLDTEQRAANSEEDRRQERTAWLRKAEEYAISCVPLEVPPELRLEALSAVRRRLVGLDPIPSASVTDTLVNAEVEVALRIWRRDQQLEAILIEVRDQMLPYSARGFWGLSEWQIRAIRAAGAAMAKVDPGAPITDFRTAAAAAAGKIAEEWEASTALR
jgi:excisionase family DNA binding protein